MTEHISWETLNALVDGRVTESERSEADVHAAHCSSCRSRLLALREAVGAARDLPRAVTPPAELWDSIRATIESGKVAHLGPATRSPRGWWITPGRVVAAALLLVTLTATLTVALTRGSGPATLASSLEVDAHAVSWQVAERGYQASVLELRSQLAESASQLAPATIATIEQSLATIDVAIAEAREALLRDPSNAALPELLASNYRQKIELLRRATQLASST
jgi:hypothetical protein